MLRRSPALAFVFLFALLPAPASAISVSPPDPDPAPQLSDLTLTTADITLSSSPPRVGQTLIVYARISNIGNLVAQNVLVHFYDSRSLIGQAIMPYVDPVGSRSTWISWTPDIPGPNKLSVVADPTDLIDESNEVNNFASRDIVVEESIVPDLAVVSIRPAQDFPNGNQTVDVEIDVRNLGRTGTPPTFVVLRDNETDVASSIVPALGAGGGFTLLLRWTTPAVPQPTTRVLTASVDPASEIADLNRSNNVRSRAVIVGPEPLPDLRMTPARLLLSTNIPLDNQTVTVYADLENRGTFEARDVVVSFREDGAEFDRDVIALVAPGFGARAETRWNPRAGIRQLAAVADPQDAIRESDERNNVALRSIFVDQYLPVVAVPDEGIRLSDDLPLENQTVTVLAAIRNDGTATLFEGHVEFFDRMEFANGSFLETKFADDYLSKVSPGAQRDAQARWMPQPAGVHYLVVRARALNTPGEQSSLHDEGRKVVTVRRSLTELVVSEVAVHPRAPMGPSWVLVNVTVKNVGLIPANDVEVVVYLGATPVDRKYVTLAGDRTGSLPIRLNYSVFLGPGLHNVTAVIDPDDTTPEYDDRGNNLGYALVAVPESRDDIPARLVLFWGPIGSAVAVMVWVLWMKRRTVRSRYHRWLAGVGKQLEERHGRRREDGVG